MGNLTFSCAKVLNARSAMSTTLAVTTSDLLNFPRRTIFNPPFSILDFPCSTFHHSTIPIYPIFLITDNVFRPVHIGRNTEWRCFPPNTTTMMSSGFVDR